MENAAAPPAAKEAQDDAEVVDVEKKKGEKEEKKKEEESEEKKKGEETPRSLKTMSPSEKVDFFLVFLFLAFDRFKTMSEGESLAARGGHVGLRGWKPRQPRHEPHH